MCAWVYCCFNASGESHSSGVLENLNLRAHLENFQNLKVMMCTPQNTHTHTGAALQCACVSCVRCGGSRRGHLLFCFRAMLFIFKYAGVSRWWASKPPPHTPTDHHFTGPHQPQRRRLLQSLKLMANKIVCLWPSHAGPTHQDLSLK